MAFTVLEQDKVKVVENQEAKLVITRETKVNTVKTTNNQLIVNQVEVVKPVYIRSQQLVVQTQEKVKLVEDRSGVNRLLNLIDVVGSSARTSDTTFLNWNPAINKAEFVDIADFDINTLQEALIAQGVETVVTFTTTDEYNDLIKLSSPTFALTRGERFSQPSNGVLQFDGTATENFNIEIFVEARRVGFGDTKFDIELNIDGSPVQNRSLSLRDEYGDKYAFFNQNVAPGEQISWKIANLTNNSAFGWETITIKVTQ